VLKEQKYRVLMFSPAFAPLVNPEAIVNAKLALAFLGAGWDIDIISRDTDHFTSYQYAANWVEPWLPLREHTHEITYRAGNRLKRVVGALWSGVRMGHLVHGCRWAARAYELAKGLHARKPYDVILSRALPDVAHLPSMRLARETGLPWIANWNDPWDFLRLRAEDPPLRTNVGMVNQRFLNGVSSSATWLTFYSDRLRERMVQYLPARVSGKSSVIPQAALRPQAPVPTQASGTFQICFTGRIFRQYQDMEVFLEGFARFLGEQEARGRAIFTWAGIDEMGLEEAAKGLGIGGNVRYMGTLSYLDALSLARNSSVLLILDPKDAGGMILTTKLVDYIQTGRPILAMTTPDSTTERLLKSGGGGIFTSCEDPSQVAEGLAVMYESWRNGTLDAEYASDRLFNQFSPETIVGRYHELFERLGLAQRS
jgi:glycosyltransferase involved in cell wall biosynthesis